MSEARARNAIVLLAVLVEGGLVVLAWLLGWLLHRPPIPEIHWSAGDVLWAVGLTVPPVVLALVLLRWPIGPFARVRRFTHEVLVPVLAPCTLIDLVGIAALAGLGEEMLFRGIFQAVFSSWLGWVWGLILASILFGLLHAVTFTYALLATVLGLYLGWLWVRTENLLVPIVVHGLYDLVLLWYLLYGPGKPAQLLQEPQEEPPGPPPPEEPEDTSPER